MSQSDARQGPAGPVGQLEPLVFSLVPHPLVDSLSAGLGARAGAWSTRQFPDGESYLCVTSDVVGRSCVVIADLSYPNEKYLPLIFLLETLRDLGAVSVGLVAPYLSYMRQDCRFLAGEAITSRIFAQAISPFTDWLVTIDPHLHRYHSLDEIYRVPTCVVEGAPALADWLKARKNLLLVGPDAESEQWVSRIAAYSEHPFVVGAKVRLGDRQVEVTLPNLQAYRDRTAVIIDDVISSGHTILRCIQALKQQGIAQIDCIAVHGVFAAGSDQALLRAGLTTLVTTNTIPHKSNAIDVAPLLVDPVVTFLTASRQRPGVK